MRIAAGWLLALGTAISAPLIGQQPPEIPLRAGLTIVKAIANPDADYESFYRVDTIDRDGIHLLASAPPKSRRTRTAAQSGEGEAPDSSEPELSFKRTVRHVDQQSARHYQLQLGTTHPAVFPGTTALGVSTVVLEDLKTRGTAMFWLGSRTGGVPKSQQLRYLEDLGRRPLTLHMVGKAPVPMAVIVNNVPAKLPAIHARGRVGKHEAEFWILDDPRNPIALRWQISTQKLQVIKISFPSAEPAAQIATALERSGRADVYGIYFDVGSATIKPESEPVLAEIAAALAQNPAWKLSLEGHTDSIGGARRNLDLSRDRAAAVRAALVEKYRIGIGRLSTTGFGLSRPKDTNTTLEGRARNRRVELVRR